ncbi:caspase family protein, partial [Ascidiaceihabitans sp.]|nr:caspase family protein [Ascidiaceihabitans sp.]
MVVGVDDYEHFEAFPAPVGELSDLEGAVNDATLIASSMRRAGIDLPDSRILIDSGATVKSFLAGWKEMTLEAKSGDTIIVSFSGHGGQEREVSEPFDEKTDGLDETIMFHEFDPKNPRVGRLSDDQLRELLSKEAAYNIIWVMDSCHSAGLTRNVNIAGMGLTRSGGVWDIPLDPILGELKAEIGDDEADELPNVTQILATASEDRLVTETRFGDRAHGALSWFFAKALDGA